jgi:hypothetical protein
MNNPLNLVDPSGTCCDSCDPCEPNEPDDDCDEEELKRCILDANNNLNRCVERAAKTRDTGFKICADILKNCLEGASVFPFPVRQIFEYSCYYDWAYLCPYSVIWYWIGNLTSCTFIWNAEIQDCYRKYCPEVRFPEIY